MADARISITPALSMQRWSLRARDVRKLGNLIGAKLPNRIGEAATIDGGSVACLGPDEWLWRSTTTAPKSLGEGQPVSIVDVSERAVGFILEGADASAVLKSGNPLDLDTFAIGRTARTVFEGVEIILTRESETRWTVDVWRSFAEWLEQSFEAAAAHP